MSKKIFISTVLLFTFSIVLLHNITPHHHHDGVSDISHHQHHHDKQDHQGENDEPTGLFSHPTHLTASNEFSFTFSNNHAFQKTQSQCIKSTDFVFRQLKIPKEPEPPHYVLIAAKQSFYSSHSLRGPPIHSV